jgi:hypothetical protein
MKPIHILLLALLLLVAAYLEAILNGPTPGEEQAYIKRQQMEGISWR